MTATIAQKARPASAPARIPAHMGGELWSAVIVGTAGWVVEGNKGVLIEVTMTVETEVTTEVGAKSLQCQKGGNIRRGRDVHTSLGGQGVDWGYSCRR